MNTMLLKQEKSLQTCLIGNIRGMFLSLPTNTAQWANTAGACWYLLPEATRGLNNAYWQLFCACSQLTYLSTLVCCLLSVSSRITHPQCTWDAIYSFLPGAGTACPASNPQRTLVCKRLWAHSSAASAGTGTALWLDLWSLAFCSSVRRHTYTANMSNPTVMHLACQKFETNDCSDKSVRPDDTGCLI